jgi:putative phosphoribosyl transferase
MAMRADEDRHESAHPAPFRDRDEAARALADVLAAQDHAPPLVVLALPRGGVPVAAVVARRLGAPILRTNSRSSGAPWEPEFAVAALVDAGGPELVVDEPACRAAGVDARWLQREKDRAWQEIERRRALYRPGLAPVPVAGATVLVVDDGVATGTTARAALAALRRRGAGRVVLAVPVGASDTVAALRREFDAVVCLREPQPFRAVGLHYRDFAQVGDAEVLATLRDAAPP